MISRRGLFKALAYVDGLVSKTPAPPPVAHLFLGSAGIHATVRAAMAWPGSRTPSTPAMCWGGGQHFPSILKEPYDQR